MGLDQADALILVGLVAAGAGLYLIAWPLTLVLAGALIAFVGYRRL